MLFLIFVGSGKSQTIQTILLIKYDAIEFIPIGISSD